jgi:hypothetical protein
VVFCRSLGEFAGVAEVDMTRQRALLYLDMAGQGTPVRRWEWFSMLSPRRSEGAAPDPIAAFMAERCRTGPGGWVMSGELRAAYLEWCAEHEERALSWTGLSNALLARGLGCGMRWVGTPGMRVKVRVWRGITLRAEAQVEMDRSA